MRPTGTVGESRRRSTCAARLTKLQRTLDVSERRVSRHSMRDATKPAAPYDYFSAQGARLMLGHRAAREKPGPEAGKPNTCGRSGKSARPAARLPGRLAGAAAQQRVFLPFLRVVRRAVLPLCRQPVANRHSKLAPPAPDVGAFAGPVRAALPPVAACVLRCKYRCVSLSCCERHRPFLVDRPLATARRGWCAAAGDADTRRGRGTAFPPL